MTVANLSIIPLKVLGWAVLSPLNVIAASLQMSVMPHLGIHSIDKPVSNSKALQKIKLAKDLTIREKRNLEIKLYSGSMTQTPYTAPVYIDSRSAFR